MSGAPTKRLAVLGHPVAHSRSPAMQNAALAKLAGEGQLAGRWIYEPLDFSPAEFEQRVRAMPGQGFVGANVTIPHKEAALALADEQSPAATAIGAANTLTFEEGEIHVENTDAPGLLAALRALPASPRGVGALVLGAGGAARAAIWALAQGGAVVDVDLGPFEVDVWNRTPERAAAVAAELGGAPTSAPRLSDYGLIVNTTSVGLRGEDPFEHLRPLAEQGFEPGQVVVDMVYGDAPSRLLAAAEAAGAATVDGIEVLVQQGALSLETWTGLPAPLDTMRTAARR
jgi:shikimate dehydrogenase